MDEKDLATLKTPALNVAGQRSCLGQHTIPCTEFRIRILHIRKLRSDSDLIILVAFNFCKSLDADTAFLNVSIQIRFKQLNIRI